MEAPTYCPDPVISNTSHSNPSSGAVNPRPAQTCRNLFFLEDVSTGCSGQNGIDFVLQQFSSIRLIENTDRAYTVLLQSRGMQ